MVPMHGEHKHAHGVAVTVVVPFALTAATIMGHSAPVCTEMQVAQAGVSRLQTRPDAGAGWLSADASGIITRRWAPAGTTLWAFDGDSLSGQEQTSGSAGSHHQMQPEAGAGWLSADAFITPDGLLRPGMSYMQAATGVRAPSLQQVRLLAPSSRRLMAGTFQPRSPLTGSPLTGSHHQTQPDAGAGWLSVDASGSITKVMRVATG